MYYSLCYILVFKKLERFFNHYMNFSKKHKKNTKENERVTASHLAPFPASNYNIHQKELWHINVKMVIKKQKS